jgi:hypothetical protein
MWQLNIRKANNGYILKGNFNDSEDVAEICVEEKEGFFDNLNTLKAMRDVLWIVMEYFAINYSKHNSHNLSVVIEDRDGKEMEE